MVDRRRLQRADPVFQLRRQIVEQRAQRVERGPARRRRAGPAEHRRVIDRQRPVLRGAAAGMKHVQRLVQPPVQRVVVGHRFDQRMHEPAQVAGERDGLAVERHPPEPRGRPQTAEDPLHPLRFGRAAIDQRHDRALQHRLGQDRRDHRRDRIGSRRRIGDVRHDPPREVSACAALADLRCLDRGDHVGVAGLQRVGGDPQQQRVSRNGLRRRLAQPGVLHVAVLEQPCGLGGRQFGQREGGIGPCADGAETRQKVSAADPAAVRRRIATGDDQPDVARPGFGTQELEPRHDTRRRPVVVGQDQFRGVEHDHQRAPQRLGRKQAVEDRTLIGDALLRDLLLDQRLLRRTGGLRPIQISRVLRGAQRRGGAAQDRQHLGDPQAHLRQRAGELLEQREVERDQPPGIDRGFVEIDPRDRGGIQRLAQLALQEGEQRGLAAPPGTVDVDIGQPVVRRFAHEPFEIDQRLFVHRADQRQRCHLPQIGRERLGGDRGVDLFGTVGLPPAFAEPGVDVDQRAQRRLVEIGQGGRQRVQRHAERAADRIFGIVVRLRHAGREQRGIVGCRKRLHPRRNAQEPLARLERRRRLYLGRERGERGLGVLADQRPRPRPTPHRKLESQRIGRGRLPFGRQFDRLVHGCEQFAQAGLAHDRPFSKGRSFSNAMAASANIAVWSCGNSVGSGLSTASIRRISSASASGLASANLIPRASTRSLA